MSLSLGIGVGLTDGGGAPLLFDLSTLSGKYALYSADLLTKSGSDITAVTDQWGTNNLTQTPATKPQYTATGIGGQPTVLTPHNTYIYLDSAAFSLPQPFWTFMVGYTAHTGGNVGWHDAMTGAARAVTYSTNTQLHMFTDGGFDLPANADVTSAVVILTVFNGASSAQYITDSQTALRTGTLGTSGLTRLILGALQGGGGMMDGGWAIFGAVSGTPDATTRHNVMVGYCKARYGVAAT